MLGGGWGVQRRAPPSLEAMCACSRRHRRRRGRAMRLTPSASARSRRTPHTNTTTQTHAHAPRHAPRRRRRGTREREAVAWHSRHGATLVVPSHVASGPDGAAWAAAVCEKQMVSRWADALCASPCSAAGSQLGGLLWARVGWPLDWPRVTRPRQAQRCSPPLSERLPPCCGAAACRL